MKKYVAFVLVGIVFLLAGCSIKKEEDLGKPNSDPIVIKGKQDTESKIDSKKIYDSVIALYNDAMKNKYDEAKLIQNDMDFMIKDLYTCGLDIGYKITDLDSDGNDELMIGVASNDEGYGKLILALYTTKDGDVMKVFTGSNRNRYYYVKENLFANIASNGATDNIDTTLKYANGELTDLEYATNESSYTQLWN